MIKKRKLIFGVALNDADYKITKIVRKNGKRELVWHCPFYRVWRNMIARAYSDKWRELYATYSDCKVCEDWLLFSNFKAWMEKQDWHGKHLDKDILSKDGKLYSPETCVFIDQALNKFMNKYENGRGPLPTGVRWRKDQGYFFVELRNPFAKAKEYRGPFSCPDAAHKEYRKLKHKFAMRYADQQSDQRIADALRKMYL